METLVRTLEVQKDEFKQRKLLATPLAGLLAWIAVGLSGLFLSERTTVLVLFVATGSIVYLALIISKFTGENHLKKDKPKNTFDKLFFFGMAQALLVYSIAIPFFMADYSSLPLTIGILTGLMWFPISWILDHWVGIFHAVTRTILVLVLWYLFPQHRFTAIPLAIVIIYVITLYALATRNKTVTQSQKQANVIDVELSHLSTAK